MGSGRDVLGQVHKRIHQRNFVIDIEVRWSRRRIKKEEEYVTTTHPPVRGIWRDGSIGCRETQNGKKAELGRSDNKILAYNAMECLCSLATWTIEGLAFRNMAGSNSVAESPLKIGLNRSHTFYSVVYAIVYLFTVSIDTKADKNSRWDPNYPN